MSALPLLLFELNFVLVAITIFSLAVSSLVELDV
jgi:hypothetical protein